MATQTASQTTTNSGGTTNTGGGIVGWRDANLSIGGFDLSGFGSSSAKSGDISTGDRILGGNKKESLKFGLVKMLAVLAGVAIIFKIWKGKK